MFDFNTFASQQDSQMNLINKVTVFTAFTN